MLFRGRQAVYLRFYRNFFSKIQLNSFFSLSSVNLHLSMSKHCVFAFIRLLLCPSDIF